MKHSPAVKSALSAAFLGCMALGIASIPAAASTASATFLVSATVQTSCTVTAAPLAFGTYNGAALNKPSGGITVTCTDGTPYTIGLDEGLNGGSGNTRYMIAGTNTLAYELFSDTNYTVPWENTTGAVASTGTGGAQTPFVVYGTIPAGEAVVPGTYQDTITATVTY